MLNFEEFHFSVSCSISTLLSNKANLLNRWPGSMESIGYQLGYLTGYSKKPVLSWLLIKLIKAISRIVE